MSEGAAAEGASLEAAPAPPQALAFPPRALVAPSLPLDPLDVPVRLGRWTFPRASGAERLAWCALLTGVLIVLGLAASLTPDPRGIGTHEQIPFLGGHMKPCGFAFATGIPCPSCGYTTTFALAAHGKILEAVKNQPFGFVVFLVACALVPASLVAAIYRVSWSRVTDDWPWIRILVVTVVLWLAAWAYKIWVMPA